MPDQWAWNEIHPVWPDEIKDENHALSLVIEAAGHCHGQDITAFLCFLPLRLLEMHRVLKSTGSMYLRCGDAANAYTNRDRLENFTTAPLHTRGLSRGGHEFRWRGITDTWRFPREKLDEMDANGAIHWPPRGTVPRRKVHLDDSKGTPATNLILDIKTESRKERTGSPDDKPLDVYERIVLASSNPGDLTLNPFAGCGTTLMTA